MIDAPDAPRTDMPLRAGTRVVIAGGSGFLGVSLAAHLARTGAAVTILSRGAAQAPSGFHVVAWDARTPGPWSSVLNGADAIVNLVGRTVDCIKSPDHEDEILRSRVESTLALGKACRLVDNPPRTWVQMSTAHIYGDPPEVRCDESSTTGYGLAPHVGRAWEAAAAEAVSHGQRLILLRTSFVIGRPNSGGAGALSKLGLLARLGLGGRVGAGSQGMSWIHQLDLNRIFVRAIGDESMRGVYVASAPHPVSQLDFMRTLRRNAGGLGSLGIGLPTSEWMVRLGASLVMKTDPELALYGRYVVPTRLLTDGFVFAYPSLALALRNLYKEPAS